jgi:hypothetical protein
MMTCSTGRVQPLARLSWDTWHKVNACPTLGVNPQQAGVAPKAHKAGLGPTLTLPNMLPTVVPVGAG